MNDKRKEKIKTWLVIIMVLSLVGSFIFFFLGQFKTGLGLGVAFMALAAFIGQWTSDKNKDYLYRNYHKNNDKYNDRW
ncbi:sulfite exporter TauE/SafE family protein [Bacillus sp. T33-2]|uniref:sulfite exporter TauE/SafE family protein n=1 Tax=Bacillus sp. T33-2 TaxID=2054168 RepID=UPI000C78BFED|nr:sulfite exporter TauE/SafE family protein [Bacillus sp. T33-2]PLR98440.1 hypothetical protein CVD19_04990 [Bacillus sp. T33-2]